jgi:hypothetical protein
VLVVAGMIQIAGTKTDGFDISVRSKLFYGEEEQGG